jgi:hypothetical protein
MRIRSRLTMLGVAAVLATAGPWTGARADDWPAPGGDPFAGQGVVLADVALPSTGGVGFRVSLPTGGTLDLLGWVDSGSPAPGGGSTGDDMVVVGGLVSRTVLPGPRPDLWFLFPHRNGGPEVRVQGAGTTLVDQHSSDGTDMWLGVGGGSPTFPAGTYTIVIWAATNSPTATTRFRLHASADATLLHQTVSTTAFLRGLRQFNGGAAAAVDTPAGVATSAAVDKSTGVDIAHMLYGGFAVSAKPPPLVSTPTLPLAHYFGPDGRHTVSDQVQFNGTAAGSYTFTLDNDVWATSAPFVAGVDLLTPK